MVQEDKETGGNSPVRVYPVDPPTALVALPGNWVRNTESQASAPDQLSQNLF